MSYRVERCLYKTGRPTGKYRVIWETNSGTVEELQLPGVTTIIKAGLPAPQLLKWALEQGVSRSIEAVREALAQGWAIDLDAIREAALAEPDRIREEAADIGTEVHRCIEQWLTTKRVPVFSDPRVENGWLRFREWWDAAGLQPHSVEVPVASVRHGYAGTVDLLVVDQEFRLGLVDFKTSNGIYDSHELQAVAYAEAVEEMGIGRVDFISIARFGRLDAEFEERDIPEHLWDGHLDQFLRCLATREWLSASTRRYYARKSAAASALATTTT